MNMTNKERPYPLTAGQLSRFTAKYDITDSGCWEWSAYKNHQGYGYFTHGKLVSAHRVAYKHHKRMRVESRARNWPGSM